SGARRSVGDGQDGVAVKAWTLLLLLAAGCFPDRSGDYACTTNSDCTSGRTCDRGYCVLGEGVDGGSDGARFECATFNSRHFVGCNIPQPKGPLALMTPGTYTYDTTLGTLHHPGGGTVDVATQMVTSGRVISVDSLTVGLGATLRVTGSQPLVV